MTDETRTIAVEFRRNGSAVKRWEGAVEPGYSSFATDVVADGEYLVRASAEGVQPGYELTPDETCHDRELLVTLQNEGTFDVRTQCR